MSYVRTVYRSQVTMAPHEVNGARVPDAFRIWSIPHPIHHGLIRLVNDWWVFDLTSVPNGKSKMRYPLQGEALRAVSQIISLKAGQDMAEKFSRSQKLALGQQQCPKAMGSTLCGEPPMPGTIWCMWHPHGRPNGHV